jgi:hypothetical protein
MELRNLLVKKRGSILERWFHLIIQSYPPDTAKFLKRKKDRFANPVGHSIVTGTESIFDALVGEAESESIPEFLDKIIKVRAIQDFTPSQAVAFVFLLKTVIRDELGEGLDREPLAAELSRLDTRIDQLGLMAFDVYMRSREKLYEIRVKEVKNQSSKLLEYADRMLKKTRGAKKDSDADENENPLASSNEVP